PVPNIEAFGAARYVGRVYADYDTLEFRYSALDGTVTELEEDAMGVVWVEPDGGNRMTVWSPDEEAIAHLNPTRHVALDIMGDGSAGGRPYLQSDYGPGLGYEWTTVMTEDVPRGVN